MIMNTRKFGLLHQLLQAAVLAAGFGTLWAVLVGWVGAAIEQARTGKNRLLRESIVATADGTPLIESVSYDDRVHTTYRDVNGHEHAPIERKNLVLGMYLHGESARPRELLLNVWRNRIKVFVDEREPAAVWYFVHDGHPEGAGYFVGYEHISNRLIGYIGNSGFRAERPPSDQQIPIRGTLDLNEWWSSETLAVDNPNFLGELRLDRGDVPPRLVHVPSGKVLRLVDLGARTITTAFEAPAPIVSVSVPSFSSSYAGSESTKEQPILVWAGETIYKLNHQYQVMGTFTLPADVDHQTTVTWYETESGQSVVECVRKPKAGEGHGDNTSTPTVYLVAADGSIRQSFEVALRSGANPITEEARFRLLSFAFPGPASLAGAVLMMAMENPALGLAAAVRGMLKPALPALATVCVISSILAAIAWRQGRAFGFSRREQIPWVVFVLLFGVPGFAGFLLHRRWPARELCPHCHARCPRDRDTCAECGTPFPEPALKGTEIFA